MLPDLRLCAGGLLPGPVGLGAFAAVKFAGYVLAGVALKRLHPAIVAAPTKIAAVRTVLGILIGPVMLLAFAALADAMHWNSDSNVLPYIALIAIRVLVWALVIWMFLRNTAGSRRYLWVNAGFGAMWSCLLDLPAIFLLEIAPGKIPIC
jgi:hypothetical protein